MCHASFEANAGAHAEIEERDVSYPGPHGPVPCLEAQPRGHDWAGPTVMVVPDIHGRTPFYEQLCRCLAGEGLSALLPDYFHAVGPVRGHDIAAARERRSRLDEAMAVTDLLAAVAWLRRTEATRPIAALGCCLGGTFVLHLAADGEALPVVCFYGFPGPSPNGGVGAVVPPLDRPPLLRNPVLGFWGSEDAAVGIDNVTRFAQLTREAGSDVDVHIYSGAGHGFLRRLGSERRTADARAASDAWRRTLAFLASQFTQSTTRRGA